MKLNQETLKRRSAYFIFWSWHLIYTVLVVTLIIPYWVWPLINAVMEANVPWHYLLYAILMTLLPFISIALGVTVFRGNFRNLMKYFYGFEMPLLFFLLVRMMTFRDSNPGVSWLMINGVIALTAWFIFLWLQNKPASNRLVGEDSPAAIAGSAMIALVGLYFGMLFLIIMIPLGTSFIVSLGEVITHVSLKQVLRVFINPLIWLALCFAVFTMILFIALPVVMIRLYMGQFIARLPSLWMPGRLAIVVAVIGLNVTIFGYLNQQPQQAIFSLLDEKMGQEGSEAELLQQADDIKAGLLNAYLARYRYISTEGLSQRIKSSYRHTVKLKSSTAEIPQKIFNSLVRPFLYDGKDWRDVDKAKKWYESFFDAPIQKAERDTILEAVKRNWEMSSDNEAGLLDAANHHVHLNQQSIQIQDYQGVATITIAQILENLTDQPKEAVMHFSLPEDAVLTGLWLSDNQKEPKQYPYVLAPKGAAQAVYKAEVNRRIDPALLEQTGPYQYRLRVYPVPRKQIRAKSAKPMYMQFEYQTLVDAEGKWPLPEILEKRNLFWDNKTEHLINGQPVDNENGSGLFPDTIPSPSKPSLIASLAYRQGDKQVIAMPRQSVIKTIGDMGHFALLIDGSYSMTPYYEDILKAIDTLPTIAAHWTVYFCRRKCSLLDKATSLNQHHFFGNSQTIDQLAAFSQTAQTSAYDALFVLTDQGSYELKSKTTTDHLNLTAPLWLVHLGNRLPYAYDDTVLDLIYQSKGGVAHSLTDAWMPYHGLGSKQNRDCGKESRVLSITRNKIWLATDDPDHHCTANHNAALEKIVTAHQVRQLIKTMAIKQLDQLDAIHALAKTQGIITHYSSMLVLVNDRQKQVLNTAEQGADRFQRAIEDGQQNTTHPADPFAVSSVPEPEGWALMMIGGFFLSVVVSRRRRFQAKTLN